MKNLLYIIGLILFFAAGTMAANSDFWGARVEVAAKTGVQGFKSLGAAGRGYNQTLQTGGHTLNNSTLKALRLTKEEGNRAMHALKKAEGILPNQHGKIMANGDYVIGNVVRGNLFDYLP